MSVVPYKNRSGVLVPRAFEIIWYPEGGKGKQSRKVVKNCTKAQAELIELALIRKSVDTPPPHDPKVKDVWHEWLKNYARDAAANTVADILNATKRLLPHFGGWHLSRLTLPLFEEYMDKRSLDTWRPPIKNPDPKKTYKQAKPIGKKRINTELKYFKMFLDYCIAKKYMLPLHFSIPKFRKLPKRTIFLPAISEVDRLLLKCHEDARLAVLLYHDAGLRRNEALSLEVQDIIFEEELIRVIGKGDKERYVAIATERLYTELEDRVAKAGQGLLMYNKKTKKPYKDLRKAIEAAAERAGIKKNIYNHLFRHTYTSMSYEAAVPLPDIQEQLGHSDIKTTRDYIHVTTGKRVTRSKKLEQYLQDERTRLMNHEAERPKKQSKSTS